jgi:hypothetical protein
MNPIVWPIWPQACADKAIELGAKYCDAKQCFVSVSWLAQQVFYLPCSAVAGAHPLKGPRRRQR